MGGADLYGVLGVNKECSASELRDAYKKLALRWHPDRCSAAGNSKTVEESKNKFQAIQHAYSVLSDANKRFMYDVGAYDRDDDEGDQNGMGDFLNELAVMMSQTKPCEDGDESLEELQDLFDEMFPGDVDAFSSSDPYRSLSSSSSSSSYGSYRAGASSSNKRTSSEMSRGTSTSRGSSDRYQSFCFGRRCLIMKGRGVEGRTAGTRGRNQQRPARDCNAEGQRLPWHALGVKTSSDRIRSDRRASYSRISIRMSNSGMEDRAIDASKA